MQRHNVQIFVLGEADVLRTLIRRHLQQTQPFVCVTLDGADMIAAQSVSGYPASQLFNLSLSLSNSPTQYNPISVQLEYLPIIYKLI
jgi:hypothetical protein